MSRARSMASIVGQGRGRFYWGRSASFKFHPRGMVKGEGNTNARKRPVTGFLKTIIRQRPMASGMTPARPAEAHNTPHIQSQDRRMHRRHNG